MHPEINTTVDAVTRMKNLRIALVVFALAGFCISFLVARLAYPLPVIVVFSLFSSGVLGLAVYRECMLISERRRIEENFTEAIGISNSRLEHLYMKSLASLVEFDASTLCITRASIGFYDLLHLRSDTELSGQHLEDVLGIDRVELSSLISHISHGSTNLRRAIQCKTVDGKPVDLLMSAYYVQGSDLVEAAFFKGDQIDRELLDIDEMVGELERFRRGMVRREERVLDLKAEVNELLGNLNKPIRYQVDSSSDDTRISFKLGNNTSKKEAE